MEKETAPDVSPTMRYYRNGSAIEEFRVVVAKSKMDNDAASKLRGISVNISRVSGDLGWQSFDDEILEFPV